MRPKTAVLTIVIFGIMIVIAAYLQRDEFAVGPEWALPILLAFILPIDERRKNEKNHNDNRRRNHGAGDGDLQTHNKARV